uniref:WGS project CAEQ00000000 data, annotated contig 31 n=1 Tax=Trypanosoma congolense (strain IL3000) TaxID=1068625 RepID=F9WEU3_TRYCI|nr:unnamed protein product [Trypanosoma congolense IL3000]
MSHMLPTFGTGNRSDSILDIGESYLSSPDLSLTLTQNLKSVECTRGVRSRTLNRMNSGSVSADLEDQIADSANTGECDLARMNLLAVPPGLAFASLTSLLLSNNQIVELPDLMFADGGCGSLRTLDLNSNRLKSLPVSLFKLPQLEVLLLDHNNINGLPSNMDEECGGSFLPALRCVGLEFNDLDRFPVEFFLNCPQLEEIFLGQNLRILDQPVPTEMIRQAAVLRSTTGTPQVTLKVTNKPSFVNQMVDEKWETLMPWLKVELHKIYPDKVLPFLFIGSVRTAQTQAVYRELLIEYVLTVGRCMEVLLEPDMRHHTLPVDDVPDENIRSVFDEAFEFIDKARDNGKNVLVHCFAGVSRSATIVVAYMMSRHGYSLDEALELMKNARPEAQPNEGFMNTLRQYDIELQR